MDMTYEEYIEYINHLFLAMMLDEEYQEEKVNA